MMANVSQALNTQCALGEGPVWDPERKVVWFVDIKRHQLWHFDPENGANAMAEAPEQIGWALPAQDGLMLCGVKDGLYTFDPEQQIFKKLASVPGETADNRLNDACTDRWGRVWFGSMDDGEADDSGRFYMFDRGTITPQGPANISITNGPAVNADSSLIYFTDTVAQKIMVADLSEEGAGPARAFVDVAADFPEAYPDGPVVDADGYVWTGLFHGAKLARYSPEGRLVKTVDMPAENITKMCFGGEDMRTVFVTTARKGMTQEALAKLPLSGSLLSFRSDVAGFTTPLARLA